MVFQADGRAVNDHPDRLPRLEHELHAPVHTWRRRPGVDARHAWRGVPCPVAVTFGADLGDLTRVDHPRPLRN